MADPLSITGLAIAVVQGGFQLYAGLSEYLDAVDARSEELDFARGQAMDMRRSLEIIEQLAPKLASKHAASSSSLESFLRSCEVDLKVLNDLLLELSGPEPSGEGLRHRLYRVQIRVKRLTFPFNRSKIDRLGKRLAIVNGSLNTALNTANLEVSLVTQDQVSDVYHLLTAMVATNTSEAQIVSSTRAMSNPSRSLCGPDSIGQRNALLQLVSKPEYLRSTIDESQAWSQEPLHSSWSLLDPICSCRSRRLHTRQRRIWSSFALSSEKLSFAAHDPDCQFAGLTGTQQTFGMTFEYTGLRTLFQKAIQMSFYMTFGAGGLSVSPGIRYVPLVDEKSAPAFRLVNLLPDVLPSSVNRNSSDISDSIRIVITNILLLYSQGRASPRDTDIGGRSLMHHLASVMMDIHFNRLNKHNKDIETLALISVKKLISNGVPAMAHDHRGQSSALLYLRGLDYGDLGPLLATSLISAEPDGTLFSKRRGITYSSDDTKMAVFPRWPVLAEVAGYGPLCSATASGNHAAVAMILATKPSALQERSIFGQSPLHLATRHPSCLRLLIKAIGGDKSLLNILDAGSKSPLDYAMNDIGPESLESLKLLVEADCAIWQSNSLFDIGESYEKWELYIGAMKNRHERLKHLAIKVFDDMEIETHGLEGEAVLDGKAAAVWRLLLDKGITVPQSLSPVRQYFERRNYTMYHQVKSVRKLEKLWTLNFRDIDMLDDEGLSPLMNWRRDVFGGYETRCEWFVNHGANLEEPLRRKGRIDKEAQPITVCHNLFRLLGINFLGNKNIEALHRSQHGPTSPLPALLTRNLTSGQTVIEKLLSSRVDDACGCKCSREGCTSFVWFLKYLPVFANGRKKSFHMFNWRWSEETQPAWLADPIQVFTKAFGSIMSQDHLLDAVRCLTHAALGVKHTCCEAAVMRSSPDYSALDPDNRQHMSAEEKDELESEQASLIDLLDSLVAEFEEKSLEDRNGEPLWRADPAAFWVHIWAARMNGIVEDLNGADLTQEEIRSAENIGVEWKSPKPERPPSKAASERQLRCDYLTLEEFKKQVDRIMSQCR